MAIENGVQPTLPLTTTTGNADGGFGGFGGGWGGIWGILLVFVCIALFGGWGGFGGGWGNSAGGSGAQPNYVLTSDMSNLERKMDIIQGDNCTNFAAVQAALASLSGSMMTTMHDGFSAAELAASNRMQTLMGQIYAQNLTAQQTACDAARQTAEGFSTIGYNMATQDSALQASLATAARDIIDNANGNYRALHDELVADRIEAKDAKIAEQAQQIAALQLAASQGRQTDRIEDYVASQLAYYNPRPQPSYAVPAPYPYCMGGCGCNGAA